MPFARELRQTAIERRRTPKSSDLALVALDAEGLALAALFA
jgi:hypothetical protein